MQGYLPVRIDLLHPSKVLSLDQLALIETLGIGAHAVERSALRAGEHALVMGAGPIGLGVTQFALLAGATVSVVEYNPARRRFVEMMGARALGQPDSQVYDVVFDATGSAEAMNKSLDYVAATGRLVYVGLTKESLIINDSLFHRREMTVMASRNSCKQFPRIIRIIEEGRIDVNPWITDRMTLSDVPTRLKELPTKATLVKALVELDEADV
jgi:2-desacetyl-2-hydroxyethyl bacteriochlorophyllide A dehydrogenase